MLSGKGRVGKSTVAVNLAVLLMFLGRRTGLLDADIHGPSIPKILCLEDVRISVRDEVMLPLEKAGSIVMSIGFLLQNRDARKNRRRLVGRHPSGRNKCV